MVSPLLPFQDEFPGIVQAVHIPPAETPEFFTQGKRRPVFPDQGFGLAQDIPSYRKQLCTNRNRSSTRGSASMNRFSFSQSRKVILSCSRS